uniref:Carboxylesterase type B domain-containing protein n=1 Tax=Chromera velia CCMP2878 TaxID=1169474 RepID=A0A0G4FHI0_9ALVE|eukprot:Cvel_17053.t1-p1 / transcript=Cvel_17053.t1 / gene=Cvel_17053 / organism=Chromera_velia_CCMP2878 / gene_product=Acetylcholinesterase, putative / transcript_product=Acetylcholinesterase, putative / location=Cvel_scaffold1343:10131-15652(+) / protein_length=863 / sequence_SO=supercontig / SO=protein_coding / is_pseudo=false
MRQSGTALRFEVSNNSAKMGSPSKMMLGGALLSCLLSVALSFPTTVQLPSGGLVNGLQDPDEAVVAFKGIRYAYAPRFSRPTVLTHKDGDSPIDAFEFGAACPQLCSPSLPSWWCAEKISDDCLFLNVWVPEGAKAQDDLPVLVWMHGGLFLAGSASLDSHDGAAFAAMTGAVVVTINYRLGVTGFLTTHEWQGGFEGNNGIRDQQAALRWVQDNIQAFGGDPSTITLMGESAGASSILCHLVSPYSKGLFHRVVMQSPAIQSTKDVEFSQRMGAATVRSKSLRDHCGPPPKSMWDYLDEVEYEKEWGSPKKVEEWMQCVQNAPLPSWLIAGRAGRTWASIHDIFNALLSYGPVIDGDVIPEDCYDAVSAGRYDLSIPIIIGNDGEEGLPFVQGAYRILPSKFADRLSNEFGYAPGTKDFDKSNRLQHLLARLAVRVLWGKDERDNILGAYGETKEEMEPLRKSSEEEFWGHDYSHYTPENMGDDAWDYVDFEEEGFEDLDLEFDEIALEQSALGDKGVGDLTKFSPHTDFIAMTPQSLDGDPEDVREKRSRFLERAYGDYLFSCPARSLARGATEAGGTVYLYTIPQGFDWTRNLRHQYCPTENRFVGSKRPVMDVGCVTYAGRCSQLPYACHAEEITWFFQSGKKFIQDEKGQPYEGPEFERAAAEEHAQFIANFALTGIPASAAAGHWPATTGATRNMFGVWQFGGRNADAFKVLGVPQGPVLSDYKKEVCDLWDGLSPSYSWSWMDNFWDRLRRDDRKTMRRIASKVLRKVANRVAEKMGSGVSHRYNALGAMKIDCRRVVYGSGGAVGKKGYVEVTHGHGGRGGTVVDECTGDKPFDTVEGHFDGKLLFRGKRKGDED